MSTKMTHTYLDLYLAECYDETPHMRWFEDGTCELIKAEYLKRHAPAYHARWLALRTGMLKPDLFGAGILDWPHLELQDADVSHEHPEARRESDRYVVAYNLVQTIYDLDGGQTFRRLLGDLRASPPQSADEMARRLGEVVGLELDVLLARAKARVRRVDLSAAAP